MKRLAIGLALLASPAAAQTSVTNCDTFGFGVQCQTTTTPGPGAYAPLYGTQTPRPPPPPSLSFTDLLILQSLQNRQVPAPAPKPVGREVFVDIQDYIAKGQCADAVYYARQFNDRAALDYALTCQPK